MSKPEGGGETEEEDEDKNEWLNRLLNFAVTYFP
jgi:hypothetical protein